MSMIDKAPISGELNSNTITFGKYKNGTLQKVLRDRSYCKWLLKQEWFQSNYEYLHNRVNEFEPLQYFLLPIIADIPIDDLTFEEKYKFFNLCPVEELKLSLSDDDRTCYEYYFKIVEELKDKISHRVDNGDENPYNIKAPCKWLQRFEKESGLNRNLFKDFIGAHELPNIPYLVERIKKEGGIEYNGAQSFNIAKKRSLDQEAYWEDILKTKYGEDLCTQYKYNKCIFDFITILTNTIFECKLGLKDFDLPQYKKYKVALEKFRIIYIIGYDAVINMEEKVIYTNDIDKYTLYQYGIISSKNTGLFDEEIRDYLIVQIDDLSTIFGK
jgi:hypothetical protein